MLGGGRRLDKPESLRTLIPAVPVLGILKKNGPVIADLTKADRVSELRWIDGFHKELQGRNGSGDLWRTIGRLAVVVLRPLAVSGQNQQTSRDAALAAAHGTSAKVLDS